MGLINFIDVMDSKDPDKVSVVCDGESITYHQLKTQTNNLASNLRHLGLEKSDVVGILLPNCVEYPPCFFAPQQTGMITAPISPNLHLPKLKKAIDKLNLSAIITIPGMLEKIEHIISSQPNLRRVIVKSSSSNLPKNCLSLDDLLNTGNGEVQIPDISEDDRAVYMLTSGSTGIPKWVVLSHGTIARRRGAFYKFMPLESIPLGPATEDNPNKVDLTSEDRSFVTGGLYHSGKLWTGMVRSLCVGMTFHTTAQFYPEKVLEQLALRKITFTNANPLHYGILATWDFPYIPKLPDLRFCMSTGNRMDSEVIRKFQERFNTPINEHYGITEIGSIAVNGFPYAKVTVKVIDENGDELGINQRGNILIKTPGMSEGYLNDPTETSQAFRGEWYHTGDLGKLDENGQLRILCRKKHARIIHGHEVYPDEARRILLSHQDVRNVLINRGRHKFRAYVDLKRSCSRQSLYDFCLKSLESYQIPEIEIVENLGPAWKDAMDPKEFDTLPEEVKQRFL